MVDNTRNGVGGPCGSENKVRAILRRLISFCHFAIRIHTPVAVWRFGATWGLFGVCGQQIYRANRMEDRMDVCIGSAT